MARRLSDWITAYMRYTEETEPPKSYHSWVAISTIAGALQRRVYTQWGRDKIYPNMYIVLIGPSGKCRKGTAMSIGKDLLKDIGVAITADATTREALIRKMNNSLASFTDATDGTIKFHCSLTCLSAELSVFLGQNDVKFLAALTDWYDSLDDWQYETKGAGTDHIQGMCFNLLGATAPDWLQSILPQEAIGGGFTSRIIFIVEEEKAKTVPLHELTDEEMKLKEALVDDLMVIATLSGKFQFTPEAKQFYIDWYNKQEKNAKDGKMAISDPRFYGYCDRRATHLRKLAMIMSVSRCDDLVIDIADIKRALSILEACEVSMPKTFGGLGRSKFSEATEMVLDYLILKRKTTRSNVLRMFYRDIDAPTLDIVERVLIEMKVLSAKRDIEKMEITYEYTGPG